MPTDIDALKRAAAARALEEVRSGMRLGLGSGSTVEHFLALLGEALDDGRLDDVVGVASSVGTERVSRVRGIPLSGLAAAGRLDLTVDGADEVGPGLDLVKGMGGALLREKMVAQASGRFAVIVDAGKRVERLGTRSPLPVEVVEWGWQAQAAWLEARGAEVTLRSMEDGIPFVTDNGNRILDCRFPDGIEDPRELERELAGRAGVVETGLFLGMADVAYLADADGVEVLEAGR